MTQNAETGGAELASTPEKAPAAPAVPWRMNLLLFLATLGSVFLTGMLSASDAAPDKNLGQLELLGYAFSHLSQRDALYGAQFAGSVLSILVAHEFGHYIAARIHKVEASLPFFIPMPLLSPFGTMGAVIKMRGVIPTRRALLDIGASGPLAGLAVAIPLYAWGVRHSHFVPISNTDEMWRLGESVLVQAIDRWFGAPVPEGMEAVYSPVAFGAWGGFFVTMINLFPVAQLDGGHVAYALFGPKQNRYAQLVHRAMLVFFFVILAGHLGRDVTSGRGLSVVYLGRHIGNAFSWIVWFQLLAVLGTVSSRAQRASDDEEETPAGTLSIRTRVLITVGLMVLASLARSHPSWPVVGGFLGALGLLVAMEIKGGVLRPHHLLDHPPTSAEPLDGKRVVVAVVTLVFFALLFMPEPFSL